MRTSQPQEQHCCITCGIFPSLFFPFYFRVTRRRHPIYTSARSLLTAVGVGEHCCNSWHVQSIHDFSFDQCLSELMYSWQGDAIIFCVSVVSSAALLYLNVIKSCSNTNMCFFFASFDDINFSSISELMISYTRSHCLCTIYSERSLSHSKTALLFCR